MAKNDLGRRPSPIARRRQEQPTQPCRRILLDTRSIRSAREKRDAVAGQSGSHRQGKKTGAELVRTEAALELGG